MIKNTSIPIFFQILKFFSLVGKDNLMNTYDRFVRKAGKLAYVLSAAFLIAALLVNAVPAAPALARVVVGDTGDTEGNIPICHRNLSGAYVPESPNVNALYHAHYSTHPLADYYPSFTFEGITYPGHAHTDPNFITNGCVESTPTDVPTDV
ncbi:MAG TPA: hypothetical protein DDW79_06745, partial [Anaerolineae bacterium]|nr:hypothetical protein [Anaerolineae bacterium]